MPKSRPESKLAAATKIKNNAVVSKILAGQDAVFGRIEANMGPQFRVVIYDHGKKKLIKAFGLSRKNSRQMRISIDDLVFLSSLPKEGELCEIGGCIDPDVARVLYKKGRIHVLIYSKETADTIFEREDEDVADAGEEACAVLEEVVVDDI